MDRQAEGDRHHGGGRTFGHPSGMSGPGGLLRHFMGEEPPVGPEIHVAEIFEKGQGGGREHQAAQDQDGAAGRGGQGR